MSNATGSITSTAYATIYSTTYETASDVAPVESPSEAAAVTTAGTCGATVTVTYANTVTVTVSGDAAEAATSATSDTQASVAATSSALETQPTITPSSTAAPETQAAVTTSSMTPEAVLSTVETSSASSTSPTTTPIVATPSIAASSSISTEVETTTSSAIQSVTSTSSTEAATSQAQSASPTGSKRGLFIPVSDDSTTKDYVTAFNANQGKISWIVNQFSGPPGGLNKGFNYVPQCYDKFSDVSKPNEAPHPWTTNAQTAVAAGEDYFLSFGEPNTNNSQNFYMDAQDGAQEFMTLLQPWATGHGVKVGSPGTLGSPDDVGWQNDFLDACAGLGCKISWVSCHWFSPCGDATAQELADTFYGTVNTYKSIAQNHSSRFGGNLKVWVDNFSLNCTSDVQQQFLDIVVPKMDQDDMIERYGYVSRTEVTDGKGFINPDGSISDLGLHYATM